MKKLSMMFALCLALTAFGCNSNENSGDNNNTDTDQTTQNDNQSDKTAYTLLIEKAFYCADEYEFEPEDHNEIKNILKKIDNPACAADVYAASRCITTNFSCYEIELYLKGLKEDNGSGYAECKPEVEGMNECLESGTLSTPKQRFFNSIQTCMVNSADYNRTKWQNYKDSFEETESFSNCTGTQDREFQCLSEQNCDILSAVFRGAADSMFGQCANTHTKLDDCNP